MRLLGFLILSHLGASELDETCPHPVYCNPDILEVIQTSKIFGDSKTFVDMTLKTSINKTLDAFYDMMANSEYNPSKEDIEKFVNAHFESTQELADYFPDDYNEEPRLVKQISNPVIKKFTKDVISIWPDLTRIVAPDVHLHPEIHSLIPVDKPFIVPGGRFREYYYWDTYWIVKGLLLSDMPRTARGVIENLLSVVERYGFVPNGGRFYYLDRSQPPLLTLMVAEYVSYTENIDFLRDNIEILNKELFFWLFKRCVEIPKNGTTYVLAHYSSSGHSPRAESYIEDIETCSGLEDARKLVGIRKAINVVNCSSVW